MTEQDVTQLSLIPAARPEPYWQGEIEIAELLDRLTIRWMDHKGRLVLKVIPRSMIESVSKFGVLHPITLTGDPQTSSGHMLILAAGRGRLQAAMDAGLTHIPARIYDITEVDANALTIIENAHRMENALSEFDALQALIGEASAAGRTATIRELCDAFNLTPQAVHRRLALSNMIPDLLEAYRDGKIAQGVAEQVCKLDPIYQKRLLPVLAEKKTVTGDDVRAARSVMTAAAVAEIPAFAFDTPAAPPLAPGNGPQPVQTPLPDTVYVINAFTRKGNTWDGVMGTCFTEQAARDAIDDLKKTRPGYNYKVTPAPVIGPKTA